jgi:paraquat-inducible protein A
VNKLESNLDDLIICRKCNTLQKKLKLPKGSKTRCIECNHLLYKNFDEAFNIGVAFSITSLILYIVASIFPIINVSIGGIKNSLTIFGMIYTLFNENYFVVGAILIVVLIIAPLSVIFSYIILAILTKLKIFKNLARHIISFLVISKDWEMIDIFAVSILVALVKLFGYAEVEFGISAIALALFVLVDIFMLKNIKAVELWSYYIKAYSEK